MSELLPTVQAEEIRESLTSYLTTTFALADAEAATALEQFLGDPADGIFKGPYVRVRVPFRPAENGWRDHLDWYEGFPPYGHQAHAFARLSSANLGPAKPRPLPTLVTTGTGSGKTESFLHPILDHVLRAKRAGQGGTKALILYPMNALANDQARRLTGLLTDHDALRGIRAALYTGQAGPERSKVTADGLITSRSAIRELAPDILLTNYKMLDQLLLRSEDQELWKQSADSLQYLVLDEFHTYDGAQGTDVAMLLRRLGLTLHRYRGESSEPDDGVALSGVTPVATSATLGDQGDPAAMLAFARTVFGEEFDADSVVTETRLEFEEWTGNAAFRAGALGLTPSRVDNALVAALNDRLDPDDRDSTRITDAVLGALYSAPEGFDLAALDAAQRLDLLKAHPLTRVIADAATDAIALDDLADRVLPAGLSATEDYASRRASRRQFMTAVLAAMSHIRSESDRAALSIDLHLWVRALSRLDRVAKPTVDFVWSDDGLIDPTGFADDGDSRKWPLFPAIYCRHCGRSGWGVELAPTGYELQHDGVDIRGNHLHRKGRFRALIHAVTEARLDDAARDDEPVEDLYWFHARDRVIMKDPPAADDPDLDEGFLLPVLVLTGEDADEESHDDVCPSCERRDGIRFVGSAIATMLSVAVTTIFGDGQLDVGEKKALVFTDSVQDAAHRAGFVQSRAHVFTLRNAIRRAVAANPASLEELVERLLQDAGDDRQSRYRLLAPEIAEHDNFIAFWQSTTLRGVPAAVMTRVRRRLLLDVSLEFGLQSRVGRTLELTGTLAAQVEAGAASKLESIGRAVLTGWDRAEMLDEDAPTIVPAEDVVRWVRGVLERMRDRGAIAHPWFKKYMESDGRRWQVWGGRPKGVGMPAFPEGRDAPGYPRVGGVAPTGSDSKRSHLDAATSTKGWYAGWARDNLRVTTSAGAHLTRALLKELDREGIIESVPIASGGTTVAYQLPATLVTVHPIALADLEAGRHLLVCDVCQNPVPGTTEVLAQLLDGPCTAARCPGRLRATESGANFYRDLYDEGEMRRVVAREHTSLLEVKVRLEFENGFKASSTEPNAPNVLVATPTLEMGIDIGDLSTVMLAGLPRTVASYLQRVGRAGRLTGNALSLAFVTGRGEQLPKLGEPLSVINGAVRPPATYLNAEEILQRQYVAFLIDRRAATHAVAPSLAGDVLTSSEPKSFLGELVADAQANAAERVSAFITTFDGLLDVWAVDALRAWATPGDEPRTSGLAAAAHAAVVRWNEQLDHVRYRRKKIGDAIEELTEKVSHPAASDEDRAELKAAQASYRLATRERKELQTEYWIGALERHGLLPNYTLLDDSVQLDVALTWLDPDTNEYRDDLFTYQRGAGIALGELAPGAVFYAQGLEILVDAVDLGAEGQAVRTWAFCPACGYATDLSVAAPGACPRCGSKGIADTAQHLKVAELEHVSSEVRRDEASISDRRDERQRERFTIQVAADLDPAGITDAWFVEQAGFGVKYARDLTIRWINLGKSSAFGESKWIAGDEQKTPLFRVCEVCGKLDQEASANSRREHRAWCKHRASTTEHTTSIALSRTLTTQGVMLRLPPSVTIGNSLAVPSLSAALLRGLREVIGGDPDHLRVVSAVEPVLSDGSENIPALLLHDAVPGGTGYLAELADPERMRELLVTAWEVVRDCPCRDEGRASCHRCLLPYAPGGAIDRVSRASAQQSLAGMLQVVDGDPTPWDVTRVDPGAPAPDSVLEQRFRQAFIERSKALGGQVTETPTDFGNRVTVKFGGSRRIWVLNPQVKLGPTTPDFVLEQHGGGAKSIAIYTDGYTFHATPAINRIADDAAKRRAARDLGYLVFAVTSADVDRALNGSPEPAVDWYQTSVAEGVAGGFGLPLHALTHITANPLDQLMSWMQQPDQSAERWEQIALALPMLLRPPTSTPIGLGEAPVEDRAANALIGGVAEAATAATPAWELRRGAVVLVAKYLDQGATDAALVLDDREATLAESGFIEQWQLWLKLSNLLGARPAHKPAEIAALSELTAGSVAPSPPDITTIAGPDISVEWGEVLAEATDAEAALMVELAKITGMPIPSLGLEVADGIPVNLAWRDQRVAVLLTANSDDERDLSSDGWIVAEPEPHAIADALGVG